MLKLLLNHWQAHREPAPFVLTDDPLYCAHLSTLTSKLPEVYSVNRVNPIFEEDEGESDEKYNHNRTLSENETRSSDDTGYTSGHRKTHKSFTDDAYSFDQTTSTDSDEPSKSVTVSADVHRVSYPDDVIVLSRNSSCSYCASSLSISSNDSSQEPYDSLTASNLTPQSSQNPSVKESMKIGGNDSLQTEVKRPVSDVGMHAREKLEKLLQNGNQSSASTSSESKDTSSQTDREKEIEKTRAALMKSLTRALNHKVPKTESISTSSGNGDSVTRSDSSKKSKSVNSKTEENADKGLQRHHSQEMHRLSLNSTGETVTRKDETTSSQSSSNNSKKHKHRAHGGRHKHDEEVPKPVTLHQLLPGHWSYDNIYLPQIPSVCYHCLHHGHHQHHGHHRHHHHHHHGGSVMPVPTPDMYYPVFYHKGRSRHSWAPRSHHSRTNTSSEQHSSPSSSKEGSSSGHRYSPDGSSRETESDGQQGDQNKLRGDALERRSLRVPKKCKCEMCLSSAFDSEDGLVPHFSTMPPCTCCYYPHRKVKFASDTDLSKHAPANGQLRKDDTRKHETVDKPNGTAFHINLHRLNGHVNEKSMAMNDGAIKSKESRSTMSRGQKEPVKIEDIYRSYPINFKDWEAHYKRNYLHKRRKRALNMIGMAIGIVLVVGVAIAITFIFLRLKRPA